MKYNNTYIAEDLNHFTSFCKKNWFRKEGKLLTFKDSDYTFGARGKKKHSWHQEPLHSRTAGTGRVKMGGDVSRFNVSFIVRGKNHKTVCTTDFLSIERGAETRTRTNVVR